MKKIKLLLVLLLPIVISCTKKDKIEDIFITPVTGQNVSIVTAERALMVIEAFEVIVIEKTLRN